MSSSPDATPRQRISARHVGWLVAFVVVNLTWFWGALSGSYIHRTLAVELDGDRLTATLQDARCEIRLPTAPLTGLRVRVDSEPLFNHHLQWLEIKRLEVDGAPVQIGGSRLPSFPATLADLGRHYTAALLGRPAPTDLPVSESREVGLTAPRRMVLQAILACSPHRTPRVTVSLLGAGGPAAELVVSQHGGVVWQLADGARSESAVVDLLQPLGDHVRARFLAYLLAFIHGAWLLLARWVRWTLLLGVPAIGLGLLVQASIRLTGRLVRPTGAVERWSTRLRGSAGARALAALLAAFAAAVLTLILWLALPTLESGFVIPVAATVGLLAGLACWSRLRRGSSPGHRPARARGVAEIAIVVALAAVATGSSAWISHALYDASPHVQDEMANVAAARAMARGRLGFAVPHGTAQAFSDGGFLRTNVKPDYLWPYWPGTFQMLYPAVLAGPASLGLEWLVNPILGGVLLALLYVAGRRYFGILPALLSALIFLVSPFSRVTSASLMVTTVAGVLAFIAAFLLALALEGANAVTAAACGITIGLAVNCRTYDGFLVACGAAVMLLGALPGTDRRRWSRAVLWIGLGGLPMLALFLWQDSVLDLLSQAAAGGGIVELFLTHGLTGMYDRMEALDALLTGWPQFTGPGLVLLGVLLVPTRARVWAVALWALLFPIGYMPFAWHGVMYGPRYWYPSLPAMTLLMALTLVRLGGWTARVCRIAWPWRAGVGSAIPVLVGAGSVLACFAGYLPSTWTRGYQAPNEFRRAYNDFRTDYRQVAAQYGLSHVVVFMGKNLGWQRLCSAVGDNTRHDYQGPVLYSRYSVDNVRALRRAYPDRDQYLLVRESDREPAHFALYRVRLDDIARPPELVPVPRPRSEVFRPGEDNILQGLHARWGGPMVGALDISAEGILVSTMWIHNRAFVWRPDGLLERVLGADFHEHPAALVGPQGVVIDTSHVVHVATLAEDAGVVRFALDGTFLGKFNEAPQGRPLSRPLAIAALPDGGTVVAEGRRGELVQIGRDGSPSTFLPGVSFATPVGVCIAPDGVVFVLDLADGLHGYRPDGTRVLQVPIELTGAYIAEVGVDMAAGPGRVVIPDFNASSFLLVDRRSREVSRFGSLEQTPHPVGAALLGDRLYFIESHALRIRTEDLPAAQTAGAERQE